MMGTVTDAPSKGLILVVEDERPIADIVRLYLSRDGFGVHVEHDGTAGLAAARRLRPVACVLDIALRSRSARASWSPASGRCCAGPPDRPTAAGSGRSARSVSTPAAGWSPWTAHR